MVHRAWFTTDGNVRRKKLCVVFDEAEQYSIVDLTTQTDQVSNYPRLIAINLSPNRQAAPPALALHRLLEITRSKLVIKK
jgi:hypothetical protein